MKSILRDFIIVLKAENKRMILFYRRYPLELIGVICIFYLFFVILFFGSQIIFKQNFSPIQLKIMIFSYLVWFLAVSTVQVMSNEIAGECFIGTLEYLALSKISLLGILFTRLINNFFFAFFFLLFFYSLFSLTLKIPLNIFAFLYLLPFIGIIFIFLCGLGFIVAGITLVYKRTHMLVSMILIVLFGGLSMLSTPISNFLNYSAYVLPFIKIINLIENFLKKGIINYNEIAICVGISIIWLVIGINFFKFCEKITKIKGTLGHY